MNNLYLALSVVFPLFCMMALGYFLRRVGIFDPLFLKQLNKLCFKVFLPLVLFINVYHSDFYGLISVRLILFAVSCVIAAFLLLMIVVPLFEKDNRNRGVLVQGIFRSNYILFGVPIAASLYGSHNTGTTAIIIAFVVPLFNLLSVVALSVFSKHRQSVSSIIKEILCNPLIIGSAVAFFFVLFGIKMPLLLENTVSDIAKVATPLALMILGGSFQFSGALTYIRLLIFSVVGKLIIMPGIFLYLSILFGFRGMELCALMAMFVAPTAVSTFTMAQNAGANDELAGQIVVFDSLLSVITIFVWITVLKYFNYI